MAVGVAVVVAVGVAVAVILPPFESEERMRNDVPTNSGLNLFDPPLRPVKMPWDKPVEKPKPNTPASLLREAKRLWKEANLLYEMADFCNKETGVPKHKDFMAARDAADSLLTEAAALCGREVCGK